MRSKMWVVAFSVVMSSYSFGANWNKTVLAVRDSKTLSPNDLTMYLSQYDTVVMAEKHYTAEVQLAEADIMEGVVLARGLQSKFTLGWEFLNVSEQAKTDLLAADLKAGKITADEFTIATQGKNGTAYAPMIAVAAKYDGVILGLNLTRAEKSPVTKGGLSAADPKLIPPDYAAGSAGYRERFEDAMGGHVKPDDLNNYWDAQCLTDDVMAYSFLMNPLHNRIGAMSFLVVGSFHADYFDGTVGRIKIRNPSENIAVVKIVDASDYTVDELREVSVDAKFGAVADFIYFVNEPSP